MIELSKRIESLVTHAVLGQKEATGKPGGAHQIANNSNVAYGGGLELDRQSKTLPSGKVLALEKVSANDPWRVREVDGVACELICSALQEVYPQLSFAEAMRHLEEASYDFEEAAKTLLTTPTYDTTGYETNIIGKPINKPIKPPKRVVSTVFPQDVNEVVALVAYICLLLLSFYAAHAIDTGELYI